MTKFFPTLAAFLFSTLAFADTIEFKFDEGDMNPERMIIRCESFTKTVDLNEAAEAMGAVGIFSTAAGPVKTSRVLYTCQPLNPTAPIRNVILEQNPDYSYQLSFTTADSDGKNRSQSAPALYYDDMTYLGYGAESLKAALEFSYPIDLNEEESFFLDGKWIRIQCTQP